MTKLNSVKPGQIVGNFQDLTEKRDHMIIAVSQKKVKVISISAVKYLQHMGETLSRIRLMRRALNEIGILDWSGAEIRPGQKTPEEIIKEISFSLQ
jgi:hypothetical protein